MSDTKLLSMKSPQTNNWLWELLPKPSFIICVIFTQVLFSTSAMYSLPYIELVRITSGPSILGSGKYFYVCLQMAYVLSVPLFLIGLFFAKSRVICFCMLFMPIVHGDCVFAGMNSARLVRMAEMQKFATRSMKLVESIKNYELNEGHPPTFLLDLVPDYLDKIPDTGMPLYPKYDYKCFESTDTKAKDNPWMLWVFTPNSFLNFDRIIYLPKENYPEYGYGGGLERVGNWAYVHE